MTSASIQALGGVNGREWDRDECLALAMLMNASPTIPHFIIWNLCIWCIWLRLSSKLWREQHYTAVTKGIFKKSIFQWTELFCQTVKSNRPPAYFKKFFKKYWALKKKLRQIGTTRNAQGQISKKKFFYSINICVKKLLFFLKIASFYH